MLRRFSEEFLEAEKAGTPIPADAVRRRVMKSL